MNPRSIETRLAAWYSLLLLGGLLSLGGALWWGLTYSLTAAVDDALEQRIESLVDFVDEELGLALLAAGPERRSGEIKGDIEAISAGRLQVAGTMIRLTQKTRYESDLGRFSPEDLQVGRRVGIEVVRDGEEWVAEELTVERGLEAELREELGEYTLAQPEGGWTEIRCRGGDVLLAQRAEPPVDWLERPAQLPAPTTVDGRRVLQRSIELAGRPCRVQTASSLATLAAARARLLGWLVWAIPVGLVLSAGGGYVIARRALRPLERVADVAGRITVERLDQRLEVPASGDVVERLAATFNGMLERLAGSVRRLEEFTADASHELRSPVAVIRTTAELALRQGGDARRLEEDLTAIRDEAARLTALIEDLMLLARAGEADGGGGRERVDLAALAGEVADACRRLYPGRSIAVVADGPAVALGSESALRRILTALTDNALRHTPTDARVSLQVTSRGGECEVAVVDTGPGIAAADRQRVFARFYRADASRDRTDGGFGLGLSIAQRLAEAQGGSLELDSRPGEGSTFTLRAPGAEQGERGPGTSGTGYARGIRPPAAV